ncbi:PCI domain-containing protein [Poronia punctata]|nr:PCI domain-containing protein [Poronia punctata]
MEQSKALNALEPFLTLTKSATAPRAAADLVARATSHPNTYVFAELLHTPQIQALSNSPEYGSYLNLLKIFSYGTYADYTSIPNLPPLSDAQGLKLRQLSLLTLAKNPHNLSYAALQKSLDLSDVRAVEDLVISATYAGLVDAQLDPRNGVVHISSVAPLRDLAPGSVPSMLNTLRTWSGRCTTTLDDLEAQIAGIKAEAARRHNEKKEWEEEQARLREAEEKNPSQNPHDFGHLQSNVLNRTLARIQGQRFGKRGSGSLDANTGDDETMDIDEVELDDGEGAGSSNSASSSNPEKKRASRRKL